MKTLTQFKQRVIAKAFFEPQWYAVFMNPYYICRRGLYLAIQHFSATLTEDRRVLDVGCGNKPYRKMFKTKYYTGIDIAGGGHTDNEKQVDQYYDGSHIPFAESSFDAIICTQVLEHANDPHQLMREFNRVLRKGGSIFLTMPFTYPEHEIPYDFRRYTRYMHTRLLTENGFEQGEIKQTTGFFGTFGQLLVIYLFEAIHFRAPLLKLILSILICAPIQIVSIALDTLFGKRGMTLDYIVIATKK